MRETVVVNEARPLAVFRVDASPQIGGGHVMRCLALAQVLVADGWRLHFVSTAETRSTITALSMFSHEWTTVDVVDDCTAIPTCDLLIIDHYGLDFVFEISVQSRAKRVLVIDDLADRRHDCDLLLDQTLGRSAEDYSKLVPSRTRILCGTEYALLRPQFFAERFKVSLREGVHNVVVMLGTTDPARMLPQVLVVLRRALPKAKLTIIVGSSAPHLVAITKAADKVEGRLCLDVSNMAGVLGEADIAVAAGGSVTWELCALGRPMILLQTSKNQTGVVRAMKQRSAARVCDFSELETVVHDLSVDAAARFALAATASSLCDGRGAYRLAMTLRPEKARDGTLVTLRPATIDDTDTVLDWQRAPGIRQFARNSQVPSDNDHSEWMTKRLSDPGSLFNIIVHNGVPAGVVRVDRMTDHPPMSFEVSIFISEGKQRLGLGQAALGLIRRLVPEGELYAIVHADNLSSHALFLSAGYSFDGNCYRSQPLVSEST